MADRRAKQRAFEEKRMKKEEVVVNEERELTIYTASINFGELPEVDHVFDLSTVMLDHNFSLKQTALDPTIYEHIMSVPKFQTLLQAFLEKIEKKDFNVILVTCAHGKHRSVAMAEAIKRKYPLSSCRHLMLE